MSLPGTNDESTNACIDRSAFPIPWVENHMRKAQERLANGDLEAAELLEQVAELDMARGALAKMSGWRMTEETQM
jgi:hypothetical protein